MLFDRQRYERSSMHPTLSCHCKLHTQQWGCRLKMCRRQMQQQLMAHLECQWSCTSNGQQFAYCETWSPPKAAQNSHAGLQKHYHSSQQYVRRKLEGLEVPTQTGCLPPGIHHLPRTLAGGGFDVLFNVIMCVKDVLVIFLIITLSPPLSKKDITSSSSLQEILQASFCNRNWSCPARILTVCLLVARGCYHYSQIFVDCWGISRW